ALTAGLEVTARDGAPPVAAEVAALPDDLLLIRLHGPDGLPVRVAPALGDVGFTLFVQPGRAVLDPPVPGRPVDAPGDPSAAALGGSKVARAALAAGSGPTGAAGRGGVGVGVDLDAGGRL